MVFLNTFAIYLNCIEIDSKIYAAKILYRNQFGSPENCKKNYNTINVSMAFFYKELVLNWTTLIESGISLSIFNRISCFLTILYLLFSVSFQFQ